MWIFAGGLSMLSQRYHSRMQYRSRRIPALIGQMSFDRIQSPPDMGFGDAISQNHCHLCVRRGDRFFNICVQLGRSRVAWLLMMFLKCTAIRVAQ
jgi:hypothetical protein